MQKDSLLIRKSDLIVISEGFFFPYTCKYQEADDYASPVHIIPTIYDSTDFPGTGVGLFKSSREIKQIPLAFSYGLSLIKDNPVFNILNDYYIVNNAKKIIREDYRKDRNYIQLTETEFFKDEGTTLHGFPMQHLKAQVLMMG